MPMNPKFQVLPRYPNTARNTVHNRNDPPPVEFVIDCPPSFFPRVHNNSPEHELTPCSLKSLEVVLLLYPPELIAFPKSQVHCLVKPANPPQSCLSCLSCMS